MASPSGSKPNLVVVSNRLPLSVRCSEDGSYQATLSSGGLVTALSGLTKTTSFRWYGWPGMNPRESSEREEVRRSMASHNAMPIFLDEELAYEHYNGFSSRHRHAIYYQPSRVNSSRLIQMRFSGLSFTTSRG
jgi:trehalose 6-phosphate synthase